MSKLNPSTTKEHLVHIYDKIDNIEKNHLKHIQKSIDRIQWVITAIGLGVLGQVLVLVTKHL